tara:strand:- start:235 stop:600 length:366 start_codon:yes stop_codon:yes gene_type:complete
MKKVHKKRNVPNFFVLAMLVSVMFLLVFMKGGEELDLTGKFVTGDYFFNNERWNIPSCTYSSAEDAAVELEMGYGCVNYCSEAAYGIPLPGNVIVDLNCPDNQQRSLWVSLCNDAYVTLCA